MTLNPIQFGNTVVNQFGRYLTSNFSIADPELSNQFKKIVKHSLEGEGYFAKGPYVHLNQPFVDGIAFSDLIKELDLHPGVKAGFKWPNPHKHQEEAIRAIMQKYHSIITTGTGSGKTECFLIPVMDTCLKKRDQNDGRYPGGVVAVFVYPMNALVNDQMKRLRTVLAGTGITYGRYTGETPKSDPRWRRFSQPRRYTPAEEEELMEDPDGVPYPWELCQSIEEIREKKPMILLTNYKQLEYLLIRNKDIELFHNTDLRYLVFDEVHTYTGILGSEVSFLIRRLKALTKAPGEIICIGTSATVTTKEHFGINTTDATLKFGHRLFGVDKPRIKVISEYYQVINFEGEGRYLPEEPENPREILDNILSLSSKVQLQDSISDIPLQLVQATEELCGEKARNIGTNLENLSDLLKRNELVYLLNREFATPNILHQIFPLIRRKTGRSFSDDDLGAEILCFWHTFDVAH